MAQAWGYSIGFVTVIILISNIGACLGPIMQKRFFKRLLQFLVAMGAGSLVSTGLIVLIPEAFDLMAIEEIGDDYVWKSTAAVLSIYAFFSLERVLKTLRTQTNQTQTNFHHSLYDRVPENMELLRIKSITVDPPDGDMKTPLKSVKSMEEEAEQAAHGHSHGGDDKSSLAWMIMAGDALHKAVDGLSIGAAFTEDITLGMSIALAICCEEVPHELADIAILLHSGLSIKRSLFVNCLSALFCYVGLVIGVLVGATSATASQWIFAVAGGLFLYVPLVDMLPDMSNHLDLLLYQGNGEAKVVAFLHTAGLVIGAGIIVLISNISGYIVV
ncbi:metal cation symporter ZIP14-like [Physella acuta]|uniref:metal cation symporter ZIP14-like n=1 Tax=Physella acuta TaxID=109671 RepID=UPI0027DCEF39|nr:metal cation symporter ZIP14-like [Physella acuta]